VRYPFRTVTGTPAVQPVRLGVTLNAAVTQAAITESAPAAPSANLAVSSSVTVFTAAIGSPSAFTLTFTNAGTQSADGAVLAAPWLQNNANRTFAAITATPSSGVVLPALTNAMLQAGVTVTTWPAGGTVTVAVALTPLLAYVESLVTTAAPMTGTLEIAPLNNANVITVQGAAAAASVKWQDFVTPTNLATSITAGVQDRDFANIGFCGDSFTQRLNGSYVFVTAGACPPAANSNGARWQIEIIGFNAANTYTVTQDYSGLAPAPASWTPTFNVTQSGAMLMIDTDYGLLGDTLGDGVASAGNALFTVLENGNPIGTLTLVLVSVAYP
jgi:large repetitive protein